MSKCSIPFSSVTVMPDGYMTGCCMFKGKFEHISNIDSIVSFFKSSKQYTEFRNAEWYLPGCSACKSAEENNLPHRKSIYESLVSKDKIDGSIKHLEVSFGNTCNLTCVMCESKFSTAWAPHEIKFDKEWKKIYPPSLLEYSDIDKLVEIIPSVDVIEVKGGEPLYDKRFSYFLDKIQGTKAEFNLITNFTTINDRHLAQLQKIKNLKLTLSVDGTGQTYEWIRGFKFDSLVHLMEKYLPKINGSFIINFTTSCYNVNQIPEFCSWIDEFSNRMNIDFVLNFNTVASYPAYVSPLLVNTAPAIKKIQEMDTSNMRVKFLDGTLDTLISFLNQLRITDIVTLAKHKEWHKQIAEMRGFDVYQSR